MSCGHDALVDKGRTFKAVQLNKYYEWNFLSNVPRGFDKIRIEIFKTLKTMKLGVKWAICIVSFFSLSPAADCISPGDSSKEQRHQASSSYFERYEFRKLISSANATTKRVHSSVECAFTCNRLSRCSSFNFQRTADAAGQHICEILSFENANASRGFKGSASFDHFSLITVSISTKLWACPIRSMFVGEKQTKGSVQNLEINQLPFGWKCSFLVYLILAGMADAVLLMMLTKTTVAFVKPASQGKTARVSCSRFLC